MSTAITHSMTLSIAKTTTEIRESCREKAIGTEAKPKVTGVDQYEHHRGALVSSILALP
jgi:hypothetical protein